MSKRKVVIVGAGPGGLASAMQLAHAGCDVTILERLDRPGGRTSSIEMDGYRFDCGPTFFLYPRVLREIFNAVGYDLFEECPMVRLDPQYRLTFAQGGKLDCTPDVASMDEQIAKFAPQDVGAFKRYLDDNRAKLESFRPILESPFTSAADLIRPSLLPALKHLHPFRSLGAELEKYFEDPRLVIAFAFQSKYLGMSPFNCPSLFSILSFLEYENGVWHPLGGCGQVSQRMAEIAESLGVKIRYQEPVTKVDFNGQEVVGLHTEKGRYDADAFVVNADFANWMTQTVPDHKRRKWKDRNIAKKRFSCSTFMMYLGIEGIYHDLPHHNIHICKDYQQNLQDIETNHQLSDDPSLYVQNASVTDPSLAPSGHSALYVLVPVTHQTDNVDWNTERARYRELTLDKLSQIGLTDIRDRIRCEKIITPDQWQSDYAIYKGATFNLAHNLGQMLHKRPGNRFKELGRVFLVGGGTHPGSGLPVIYESSRISSRMILNDFGIGTSHLEAGSMIDAPEPVSA